MTFLPYGESGGLSWFGAFGTSVALHGGAALALVGVSGTTLTLSALTPAPPPSFEVTVEELDADTLAGLLEQAGLAGSEGETLAPDQPPAAYDDDGPDEAMQPETIEAEPLSPDPGALPLEVPEPLDPEIAALDPVEEPAPIEPEQLAPVSVEPIAAPIVTPDLTPLSPIVSEGFAAPEGMAVETIDSTSQLAGLDVVTTTDVLESVDSTSVNEGEAQPAAVDTVTNTMPGASQSANEAPLQPVPPPAPPTAQDLAVRDLITRIQAAPTPDCLLALPRRDGADGVGLAFLASQEIVIETYAQSLLTADDADIRQTRALVDPRQCPALNFVAATQPYPALQIGIQIEQVSVNSGDTLTGALRGVGGRFLTLVLVDDNGVVTDLQRFTSNAGDIARFDVPVTRLGLARETRPIILALVTDRPAPSLRDRMGLLAEDVFQPAVTDPLGDVRIGLVAVDIR